ncbi:hypothetical protein MKX01_039700 [Papaver californicum]|nr:hypothetical protein MKX01_039700 [Papaver californicum]
MVDGDSDARLRQMEADEILARQLQEQLYDEMPGVGDGENDASLAWRLQQQEQPQCLHIGGQHRSTPQLTCMLPWRWSQENYFERFYLYASNIKQLTRMHFVIVGANLVRSRDSNTINQDKQRSSAISSM